ncbi:MAG: imidazolonepropionase [Fidelibacterota bacterium]
MTDISALSHIGKLVTTDPKTGEVRTYSKVSLYLKDGRIHSIQPGTASGDQVLDCHGKLVTPGFVDPHTHPVFFRGREQEFMDRLAGKSYQEIAATGGGIQSSIDGVRSASREELIDVVRKRMDRFLSLGTTTVEAKSGYGLDLDSELKSLAVLDAVNQTHSIDIHPTFMGAHAIPPEYAGDKDGYVGYLCDEMIPAVARQGIAEYIDVFCEQGYFTVADSRKILKRGREFGLGLRMHADEFKDSGAASLAGECGCVTADHLMAVSRTGIMDMVRNQVIGTLLPGTTFFLGSTDYAPARDMVRAGMDIALATDYNPGSCHIQSMPFIITLACIYLHLPVQLALKAATFTAAKTLDREHEIGAIAPGYVADLIIWDLEELVQIPYTVSDMPIRTVLKRGEIV